MLSCGAQKTNEHFVDVDEDPDKDLRIRVTLSVCLSVQDKMLDVYWLLCVCIRTIEHADNTGSLFAFAPEFYLNVAMNAYSALKNYFSPANSMEELPGKTRFSVRRLQ